jgi:nucleotide-binding universal stress UspA family protein
MSDFLTVVAALDDDPGAHDVLHLAHALTDLQRGDRLFAAHAVPTMPDALGAILFPYTCFGDDEEALRIALARGVAEQLGRRLDKALPSGALRITHGGADALLGLVDTLGPDVLVVGTGTLGSDAHVVGGMAARLARRSPSAVAFARPESRGLSINRIAVAIDLTDDAADLLGYALRLAGRVDATVTPITVVPGAAHLDHADLLGNDGGAGRARKAIAARWAQIESRLDLPFPVASTIRDRLRKPEQREGDPGKAIVDAAAELEADLVIAGRCVDGGSGQRVGRVAEYIARHARASVLLVPPEPREPHPSA